MIVSSLPGADVGEGGEQVVGGGQVAVAGADEEVAFTDAGGGGGGVVADAADEQAVAFGEPDGTTQPGGDVRGSEGDTQLGARS